MYDANFFFNSDAPTDGAIIVGSSRPSLTLVLILRMEKIAHSPDRHAKKLEATIPGMIERALATVTP